MGMFDWMKVLAQNSTTSLDSESRVNNSPSATPSGGIEASSELSGLDFAAAIEAHRQWRSRLMEVIDGRSSEQLDHRIISQDDQCTLGKWIYSDETTSLAQQPVFQEMKKTHAEFHIQAGEIVALVNQNQQDKALELMNQGSFSQHSYRLQTQLAKLFVENHDQ